MRITQKDRILRYVEDYGSITAWEAYKECGVTQLGARIFELKRAGHTVRTEPASAVNRYGERIHYTRYYIDEEARR